MPAVQVVVVPAVQVRECGGSATVQVRECGGSASSAGESVVVVPAVQVRECGGSASSAGERVWW